jgi:hypothetical protein
VCAIWRCCACNTRDLTPVAIDAAEASGWQVERDPEVSFGTKMLETGEADVGIARADVRGTFRVSIQLRHF